MRRHLTLPGMAVIGAVLIAGGCRGTSMPNFWHPGPAGYQRQQATRFDPYPQPNIAPTIEEGRPPGYQTPIPETNRARWTLGQ